ncbi:MAG: radical SAM protein [Planctomycetes bacterium]|nr:radical SAM protein [Planctomycetota bacterium]
MSRISIVSPDLPTWPGVPWSDAGARALGLAAGLAAHGHAVTLHCPLRLVEAPPPGVDDRGRAALAAVAGSAYMTATLASVLDAAKPEVVVFGDWTAATYALDIEAPVVLDLASSALLERSFGAHEYDLSADVVAKVRALARADRLIAPGPRQRDFFAAWMTAAGLDANAQPITVVPFGLPGGAAIGMEAGNPTRGGEWRAIIAAVAVAWPWRDLALVYAPLLTALEKRGVALALALRRPYATPRHPFVAGQRPALDGVEALTRAHRNLLVAMDPGNPGDLAPTAGAAAALDLFGLSQAARVAFSPGLLPFMASGLPAICASDHDLAESIAAHRLGWVVEADAPGAWDRLATVVAGCAPQRAAFAARARAFMRRHDPRTAAASLAAFCASPRRRSAGQRRDAMSRLFLDQLRLREENDRLVRANRETTSRHETLQKRAQETFDALNLARREALDQREEVVHLKAALHEEITTRESREADLAAADRDLAALNDEIRREIEGLERDLTEKETLLGTLQTELGKKEARLRALDCRREHLEGVLRAIKSSGPFKAKKKAERAFTRFLKQYPRLIGLHLINMIRGPAPAGPWNLPDFAGRSAPAPPGLPLAGVEATGAGRAAPLDPEAPPAPTREVARGGAAPSRPGEPARLPSAGAAAVSACGSALLSGPGHEHDHGGNGKEVSVGAGGALDQEDTRYLSRYKDGEESRAVAARAAEIIREAEEVARPRHAAPGGVSPALSSAAPARFGALRPKAEVVAIMGPCWGVTNPPLGIAYLATYLQERGITARAFDLNVRLYNRSPEEIQRYWNTNYHNLWKNLDNVQGVLSDTRAIVEEFIDDVLAHDPRVVGFSCNTANVLANLELARMMRRRKPDLFIVFGGPQCLNVSKPSDLFEGTTEHAEDLPPGVVDAVVIGEGEVTFFDLCDRVLNGRGAAGVDGVMWKDDAGAYRMPEKLRENLRDLDDLPIPLLETKPYPDAVLPIMMSRGCPMLCTFCSDRTRWKKFRYRSAEKVFHEICVQRERYGISKFIFLDSLVNASMKELLRLADLLIAAPFDIDWAGNAVIRKEMTAEYLKRLKESGCSSLAFGAENFSDSVLTDMRRLFRKEDVVNTLRNAKKAGIQTVVNIIVGFPTETDEDFDFNLKFLEQVAPYIDIIGLLSDCQVIKGTTLYHEAGKVGVALQEGNGTWVSEDGKNTPDVRRDRHRRMAERCRELGLFVDFSNYSMRDVSRTFETATEY